MTTSPSSLCNNASATHTRGRITRQSCAQVVPWVISSVKDCCIINPNQVYKKARKRRPGEMLAVCSACGLFVKLDSRLRRIYASISQRRSVISVIRSFFHQIIRVIQHKLGGRTRDFHIIPGGVLLLSSFFPFLQSILHLFAHNSFTADPQSAYRSADQSPAQDPAH